MSRIRNKPIDVSIPDGECEIFKNFDDSPEDSVLHALTGHPLSFDNQIEDTVTSDFFSKSESGDLLPVNPMTQSKLEYLECSHGESVTWLSKPSKFHDTTKVTLRHPIGYQALYKWGGSKTYSNVLRNNLASGHDIGTPILRSAADLAVEATARVRSQGLDVGTFVAEFRKTVRLIDRFQTNVFRRANQLANAHKANIAQKGLTAFSESWMEGRYGWRILLYDINEINLAVEKLKSGITTRARAYASDEVRGLATWNNRSPVLENFGTNLNPNNRSDVVMSMTATKTITRRAGALADLVLEDIAFLDPLVTAWEVIPFSFIIDWFTNIGDLVGTFSPFANGELVGLWTSERTRIERTFESLAVPYQDTVTSSVSGDNFGVLRTSYKAYERVVLTHPPFHLSFNMDFVTDWRKLVDLVALVALRHVQLVRKISSTTRV